MSSDMPLRPTRLSLAGGTLLGIDWSDGQRRVYNAAELRQNCPCATCSTRRLQSPGTEADPAPSKTPQGIQQVNPVGNYAYKIVFSDGHSTGIFPLELLRQLGREIQE